MPTYLPATTYVGTVASTCYHPLYCGSPTSQFSSSSPIFGQVYNPNAFPSYSALRTFLQFPIPAGATITAASLSLPQVSQLQVSNVQSTGNLICYLTSGLSLGNSTFPRFTVCSLAITPQSVNIALPDAMLSSLGPNTWIVLAFDAETAAQQPAVFQQFAGWSQQYWVSGQVTLSVTQSLAGSAADSAKIHDAAAAIQGLNATVLDVVKPSDSARYSAAIGSYAISEGITHATDHATSAVTGYSYAAADRLGVRDSPSASLATPTEADVHEGRVSVTDATSTTLTNVIYTVADRATLTDAASGTAPPIHLVLAAADVAPLRDGVSFVTTTVSLTAVAGTTSDNTNARDAAAWQLTIGPATSQPPGPIDFNAGPHSSAGDAGGIRDRVTTFLTVEINEIIGCRDLVPPTGFGRGSTGRIPLHLPGRTLGLQLEEGH